jgi:hypothetical protein
MDGVLETEDRRRKKRKGHNAKASLATLPLLLCCGLPGRVCLLSKGGGASGASRVYWSRASTACRGGTEATGRGASQGL